MALLWCVSFPSLCLFSSQNFQTFGSYPVSSNYVDVCVGDGSSVRLLSLLLSRFSQLPQMFPTTSACPFLQVCRAFHCSLASGLTFLLSDVFFARCGAPWSLVRVDFIDIDTS